MTPNNAVTEILELILAECRYWHGRDEKRRGNFAILYAAAKEVAEQHEKASATEHRNDEVDIAYTSCPNCGAGNAP